jgi:hypothetical protein
MVLATDNDLVSAAAEAQAQEGHDFGLIDAIAQEGQMCRPTATVQALVLRDRCLVRLLTPASRSDRGRRPGLGGSGPEHPHRADGPTHTAPTPTGRQRVDRPRAGCGVVVAQGSAGAGEVVLTCISSGGQRIKRPSDQRSKHALACFLCGSSAPPWGGAMWVLVTPAGAVAVCPHRGGHRPSIE